MIRRLARSAALIVTVAALSACGDSNSDAGPGEVTVSEAKALDEAAEMIEARRPPEPLVTPSAPMPPAPEPAR